jgi:hypothetical protein
MAMDIITKEKKSISWHGLPANVNHDLGGLRRDEIALKNSIVQKKKHLSRILQNVGYLFSLCHESPDSLIDCVVMAWCHTSMCSVISCSIFFLIFCFLSSDFSLSLLSLHPSPSTVT